MLLWELSLSGFFTSGVNAGFNMILVWVLANGIPAALGAIIAVAHPLTILISFVAAPITSMNPTIGVGFVSGLLESSFRKPRISDLENLQDDAGSVKGWYRNRVLRILLVFLPLFTGERHRDVVGDTSSVYYSG